jgi:hypothetical protein
MDHLFVATCGRIWVTSLEGVSGDTNSLRSDLGVTGSPLV